jgi:hypothetical protein
MLRMVVLLLLVGLCAGCGGGDAVYPKNPATPPTEKGRKLDPAIPK